MHTGSDFLETWIPDGGFMIERRKLKNHGRRIGGCRLTWSRRWSGEDLIRDVPCTRQPCLHLESAVFSVSILFELMVFSPGPGCGRHIDHSGAEKLQAELDAPRGGFVRVTDQTIWRPGALFY
jgi:hypothetical protein